MDELSRILLGGRRRTPPLEQQMLRRLDGQTFLGSKRVARQKLPEHTETTVHRVKVSLLD